MTGRWRLINWGQKWGEISFYGSKGWGTALRVITIFAFQESIQL
jgi:hypothetical protein